MMMALWPRQRMDHTLAHTPARTPPTGPTGGLLGSTKRKLAFGTQRPSTPLALKKLPLTCHGKPRLVAKSPKKLTPSTSMDYCTARTIRATGRRLPIRARLLPRAAQPTWARILPIPLAHRTRAYFYRSKRWTWRATSSVGCSSLQS
jgi:hypothetical protein